MLPRTFFLLHEKKCQSQNNVGVMNGITEKCDFISSFLLESVINIFLAHI